MEHGTGSWARAVESGIDDDVTRARAQRLARLRRSVVEAARIRPPCDRDRYPTGQDPRHEGLGEEPTREATSRARAEQREASLFIWDNARARAYPSASHHRAATLGASSHAHAAQPYPLGVTGPIAEQHSPPSKRGETPFWGPGALRSACIVDFIDSFAPKTVRGPSTTKLGEKTQKPEPTRKAASKKYLDNFVPMRLY